MIELMQDLTNPTETALGAGIPELTAAALALPEPQNYFAGQAAVVTELPDNVLLFCRRRFGAGAGVDAEHHRHVLVVCLENGGDVCLNENLVPLATGQALLIFPHQLHHYLNLREPLCWLFITFELRSPEPLLRLRDRAITLSPTALQSLGRILHTYLNALGEHGDVRSRQYLVLNVALLLQELLATTGTERLAGTPFAAHQGLRLTLQGAAEAPVRTPTNRVSAGAAAAPERRRGGKVPATQAFIVDRVNRYIYAHLDRKLTLAEIARHVGVSPSHLRFLVRRSLGVSLGQYLKRVQVNRAVSLLSDGCLTVGEVAAACGFASIFAFSRAFRRLTGRTPRSCRPRAGGTGGQARDSEP